MVTGLRLLGDVDGTEGKTTPRSQNTHGYRGTNVAVSCRNRKNHRLDYKSQVTTRTVVRQHSVGVDRSHVRAPTRHKMVGPHHRREDHVKCSHDAAIQYLYIGRCCLEDEDSAESVVSYVQEDCDANIQPTEQVLEASSPNSEEKAASTALGPSHLEPQGSAPPTVARKDGEWITLSRDWG
jgi:hypothetical protein